jgi:hypothetical protein
MHRHWPFRVVGGWYSHWSDPISVAGSTVPNMILTMR